MKNKILIGSLFLICLLFLASATIDQTSKQNASTNDYEDCIYEINYPDGNGSTIQRLSKRYAESYFINGVHQNIYYFIPLEETDTIFFVGSGQSWNMRRISCN